MSVNHSLLLTTLLAAPQALAQTKHVSAFDGPVSAGFGISSERRVQFNLSYTGHLYVCTPPHYDGTPITAVFTFGVGDAKFPYTVPLGRSCTTPWSYMLPTEARLTIYGDFDDNSIELWNHIRTQVYIYNAPVGLAFQDDKGRWDSRFGQNYQLHFRAEN